MKEKIFTLISGMESDLASMYGKLAVITAYSDSRKVFLEMKEESRRHSGEIACINLLEAPRLNTEKIYQLHQKLKLSVINGAGKEKSAKACKRKCARAEETMKGLYESLEKYYTSLSDHYAEVAATLGRLAQDEREHWESLMTENDPK